MIYIYVCAIILRHQSGTIGHVCFVQLPFGEIVTIRLIDAVQALQGVTMLRYAHLDTVPLQVAHGHN
jgi:hypothetical protein